MSLDYVQNGYFFNQLPVVSSTLGLKARLGSVRFGSGWFAPCGNSTADRVVVVLNVKPTLSCPIVNKIPNGTLHASHCTPRGRIQAVLYECTVSSI